MTFTSLNTFYFTVYVQFTLLSSPRGTSDFELMGNCLLQDVIQSDQSVSMKTSAATIHLNAFTDLCV